MTSEKERLQTAHVPETPWKKWGPYLSERQWGTVREDYSDNGNAWDYFSHNQSRARAYQWGEDGIGGISDDKQILCWAIGLWNGVDTIIKERLFGLTNSEGNHGEDVKEYYYYLDSTPTHSYMKFLYKYPQLPFPYDDLVKTNKNANRHQLEYELIDTGIFAENKYFDVFIEYAKETAEDILIAITIFNRSDTAASLHLLPHLWFRNTWSWHTNNTTKPNLKVISVNDHISAIHANHPQLGDRYLYCEGQVKLLFTENETNKELLFQIPNDQPYVKDGINNYLVNQQENAINHDQTGTKAAAHYQVNIKGGESTVIRLRLSNQSPEKAQLFGDEFHQIMSDRRREADEFYAELIPPNISADANLVMRQALAGMLWTKQYYYFDLKTWLAEHKVNPYLNNLDHSGTRNKEWFHAVNEDIISMPDKWEYPWFAAWDLAFHAIVLALVDIDFAKAQLSLMLQENYLHPNGQIPAYEWNFSDVNPPVHAWAVCNVYFTEKNANNGQGDLNFLKTCFHKLLMNFTWWVNRKDTNGDNIFQGGFLGLDNIGVFDRSSPLPTGGHLEQADGTAWMVFYCQNMLTLAIELAIFDRIYEDMACKFYEHFIWIASAMDKIGDRLDELWDAQDGFFYDLLRLPNGEAIRLKVRSMVGLIPLFTAYVIPAGVLEKLPKFQQRVDWFNQNRSDLVENLSTIDYLGKNNNYLLAIVDERKLRLILTKALDEMEFLSDYGIRALSRYHADHPYTFKLGDTDYQVAYEPAESTNNLFGGNSNWRGPIWLPVNFLFVRSLIWFYTFYGDDFTIEYPTGSGKMMTLWEISQAISNRLLKIFLKDESDDRRPMFGANATFQSDPHWRDYLLFYEYFHGDNGAGVGANHQTGWTGLVAYLIYFFAVANKEEVLAGKGIITTAYHNSGA